MRDTSAYCISHFMPFRALALTSGAIIICCCVFLCFLLAISKSKLSVPWYNALCLKEISEYKLIPETSVYVWFRKIIIQAFVAGYVNICHFFYTSLTTRYISHEVILTICYLQAKCRK
ncbi:hypothetical protein XELAEV_18017456mg [Xenopus laevis]|uniref:Uncharacterized protein n=1 Tax=Xenopus laevis TaxID=8355 RepID=A0A974DBM8_XENLA|nr:hypothetical protein XELAEV_18017456mg [Xenopus laevis]